MPLVQIIPKNIRLNRERLQLTLDEAARICGIPKSTFVEAERGIRKGKERLPGAETLVRISKGFGVPLYVLFEEEPKIIKYEHPLKECYARIGVALFEQPSTPQFENNNQRELHKLVSHAINTFDDVGLKSVQIVLETAIKTVEEKLVNLKHSKKQSA